MTLEELINARYNLEKAQKCFEGNFETLIDVLKLYAKRCSPRGDKR